MDIKELAENATFIYQRARLLTIWASESVVRRITTIALTALILLFGQYWFLNDISKDIAKANEFRAREAEYLVRENSYRVTLDAIDACIEATKDKSPLNGWYCDDAVARYKRSSEKSPPARVEEVIKLKAYDAMKNDVSQYVRNLNVEKLLSLQPSDSELLLNALLTKTALYVWLLLALLILVAILFVFQKIRKYTDVLEQNVSIK